VLAGATAPEQVVRGICTAGHKALYSADWGGLPDKEFLALLDPELAALRDRLYTTAHDATASPPAASPRLGRETRACPAGIPIAIGEMDVHYGAIGCGVAEGTLVKVIGTSTCDCGVVSAPKTVPDIPGICGIVPGAILPGYYGIEAGQSAVGDIFKWCGRGRAAKATAPSTPGSPPRPRNKSPARAACSRSTGTTATAPSSSTRCSPALIVGSTLHTTQAEIYRALIEATAFGARAIIERIKEYGAASSTASSAPAASRRKPAPHADLRRHHRLHHAGQRLLAGLRPRLRRLRRRPRRRAPVIFPIAQKAMTSVKRISYKPKPAHQKTYDELYRLLSSGPRCLRRPQRICRPRALMKDLIELKRRART